MSENETMDADLELEDLLSGDYTDLPDSSFEAWPNGTYKALCSAAIKKIAEQWSVEFSFKLVEIQELADEEAVHPAIGSTNSSLCQLNNEFGKMQLKKLLKPFAESFGITDKKELIDTIKDVEVLVTNKVRYDKKNEINRFNPVAFAVI